MTRRSQWFRFPLPRALLVATIVAIPASALANVDAPGNEMAPPPFHRASVANNVLTLPMLPDFRLRVSDDFTYLGSTSFRLEGEAKADVFLFVEEVGDSIRRLVKVQVESLTDPGARDYKWEGEDTLRVAGTDYIRGFWCFDDRVAAAERPESDTAKTRKWLLAAGHHNDGVFIGTRLARVFADGRSELLLFYGETTTITGVDCSDEEAAMKHLPSIVARSDAAMTLGP